LNLVPFAAFLRLVAGILVLSFFCGCRTPAPPAIDLANPAWIVRQGQAVWVSPDPKGKSEGVAGELLVATQPDGSCWVQFAKPPFNLVTAQRTPTQWNIAFQQGRQRYGARGKAPVKLIWFQLPSALAGETIESPWKFKRNTDDTWLLENPKTGERLEGYLAP
jgi:hypothetical protein